MPWFIYLLYEPGWSFFLFVGRKEEECRTQRIAKHSALYPFHGHFSYPESVPLQLIAWTLSYRSNHFLPGKNTNIVNQLGSRAP